MQMYTFDVSAERYWITPGEHAKQIGAVDPAEALINQTEKPPSYVNETGQFISNNFLFIEGLDSEVVISRVEDIVSSTQSLKTITDIDHLQYMDFVSSYIFKYVIQQNVCQYGKMTGCLKYLLAVSTYLSKKIGCAQVVTKRLSSKSHDSIPRCSYKFCAHTYCCQYNYPDKQKQGSRNKGCFSDHYPYYKVIFDIESLIKYIDRLKTNTGSENLVVRNNQEVIKCINTIAYVIKHMYDELWNLYISCGKNSSYTKMHRNLN